MGDFLNFPQQGDRGKSQGAFFVDLRHAKRDARGVITPIERGLGKV